MQRRLCSHDRDEVPTENFVLFDQSGEMYFCNLRCLAVWSVQFATKPNLSDEQRSGQYTLKTQSGHAHRFDGISDWLAGLSLRH